RAHRVAGPVAGYLAAWADRGRVCLGGGAGCCRAPTPYDAPSTAARGTHWRPEPTTGRKGAARQVFLRIVPSR
ncbi:hypothetical protein ACWIGW_14625, partial [Nocardia brasiliensis]